MRLKNQLRTKVLLEKLQRAQRIPNALLLHGPEGVGKTVAALDLSRGLLCPKEIAWGCGECSSCLRFDRTAEMILKGRRDDLSLYEEVNGKKLFLYLQGDHPDFIFVPPSGQSIRINQIRALRNFTLIRPALSSRKVVLIDDAHLMTKESANALLKTLEEPPPDTCIVLTALSELSLLPTILSRVYPVALQPLDKDTLSELLPHLGEEIKTLAGGSCTRAKLLEERQELLSLAEDLLSGDPLKIYKAAQRAEKMETEDKVFLIDLLEDKALFLCSKGKLGYDKLEMLLGKTAELREGIQRGIRIALALVALSALLEERG